MRALKFSFISDDRFDEDKRTLVKKLNLLKNEIDKLEGVYVFFNYITLDVFKHPDIYELRRFGHTDKEIETLSYRCRIEITKNTKALTWNDIMAIVNKIKAPVYKFGTHEIGNTEPPQLKEQERLSEREEEIYNIFRENYKNSGYILSGGFPISDFNAEDVEVIYNLRKKNILQISNKNDILAYELVERERYKLISNYNLFYTWTEENKASTVKCDNEMKEVFNKLYYYDFILEENEEEEEETI